MPIITMINTDIETTIVVMSLSSEIGSVKTSNVLIESVEIWTCLPN